MSTHHAVHAAGPGQTEIAAPQANASEPRAQRDDEDQRETRDALPRGDTNAPPRVPERRPPPVPRAAMPPPTPADEPEEETRR